MTTLIIVIAGILVWRLGLQLVDDDDELDAAILGRVVFIYNFDSTVLKRMEEG